MNENQKTLLIVDDEKHILSSLQRLLRRENYRILTAVGGEAGIEMLKKENVQVVVSDQRMPKMSGVEFLKVVKEINPETVRVILSGYADTASVVDAINMGEAYRFLPKPWDDDELKAELARCFEHYDICAKNAEMVGRIRSQNQKLRQLNTRVTKALDERTRFLEMSQQLIEQLPLPVIGVDPEGMIVLTNGAVHRVYPSLSVVPGANIAFIFPEHVAARIMEALELRKSCLISCVLDGTSTHIDCRLLGEQTARGCLLTIENEKNDD